MGLESTVKAILSRTPSKDDSSIVALHTQQCVEWGVRGGNIEIRPLQDNPAKDRFKVISAIWSHNEFKHRLDHVMTCLVCRGEILWLVLPDPENPGLYLIDYYVGGEHNPDPEYRVFYKGGSRNIEKVIIRYSYDADVQGYQKTQKKWVKLVINKDFVYQSESFQRPELDGANVIEGESLYSDRAIKYENPFKPYLPITVSRNNARKLGQKGVDDFTWIADLIETYQSLIGKVYRNLKHFSNPTLVTTRSAHEVTSQSGGVIPRNTFAQSNRYVGYDGESTNPLDNMGITTGKIETSEGSIDAIIGGVSSDERFAYLQVDPVSGDQNTWVKQIRESIHWILGGVDPLGISASATFGEIKTLFGRVQNLASKKADALFGATGLCKIFELIVWREEESTKKYLYSAAAILIPGFMDAYPDYSQMPDGAYPQISDYLNRDPRNGLIVAQRFKEVGVEPPSSLLIPFGDRECAWRYTKKVFQNTTREELDMSISARNEREDGLSQEWVLRKQYPDMTDQEIKNAMSGFSPRVVQNAAQGIQSTMQIFQQFMQMPDPQNPKVPWGVRLGIGELLEQAVLTLQKEIAYGKPEFEGSTDPIKSDFSLKDLLKEKELQQTNYDPNNTAANDNSVRTTVRADLPASSLDIAADRLYRSSYQNPQLRRDGEGAGYREPGNPLSIQRGNVSSPVSGITGSAASGTASAIQSVQPSVRAGDIDPTLAGAYGGNRSTEELLKALGIYPYGTRE